MIEVINFSDPSLLKEFEEKKKETPLTVASNSQQVSLNGINFDITVSLLRPFSSLEVYPDVESHNPDFEPFPRGVQPATEESKIMQVVRVRYPELLGSLSGYMLSYAENTKRCDIEYVLSALPTHPLIIGSLLDEGIDAERAYQMSWKGMDIEIDGRKAKITPLRSTYYISSLGRPSRLVASYSMNALYIGEDIAFASKIKERMKNVALALHTASLPLVRDTLRHKLTVTGTQEEDFSYSFFAGRGEFKRGYPLYVP